MQRVFIRSLVLVVLAATLFYGIVWLKNRDPGRPLVDIPPVDTRGYIAALMEMPEGERLVAIDPKGNLRMAPGSNETQDKEIVWKPDGRRIIYISNYKTEGSFQIFEWKPDRDGRPYQLTPNGASRQNPWFTPTGDMFLYASQGNILGTTYQQLKTRPIMPPGEEAEAPQTSDEGGQPVVPDHKKDVIAAKWAQLAPEINGEAFWKGFVDKSNKYFAGIYTTSRGQVFVSQHLEPEDEKEQMAAIPLGGDSIEIDMDKEQPQAIVAVQNFRYPLLQAVPKEKIKADGTVQRDFVNGVFIARLDSGLLTPLFFSSDNSTAMTSPALSPDGTEVALVAKSMQGGKLTTRSLVVAPVQPEGVVNARPIAKGAVEEPSWAPDGQTIVFVRGGDIWTVRTDGTGETNITKGRGKFHSPLFSPMN